MDVEPPIWRRFWVAETITLGRLHEELRIVLGWQDASLHQFMHASRREDRIVHTPPWDDGFGDPEFIASQCDENRVKARFILPLDEGQVIDEYNLADSWEGIPLYRPISGHWLCLRDDC
jgi:hypothetical protein